MLFLVWLQFYVLLALDNRNAIDKAAVQFAQLAHKFMATSAYVLFINLSALAKGPRFKPSQKLLRPIVLEWVG